MTLPELPALLRYEINSAAYSIAADPDGDFCGIESVRARESILVAEIERLRAHADAFAEVMACIHGDGGHYLAEHGAAKAAEDAAAKVSALRAEVKAMRAGLVPRGYVMVGEPALREWGKLDEVRSLCAFPIDAARKA